MLELEKNSSKSTSVDDTSHFFTPTSNNRNCFRRKKGDSPFSYNLNLKVKKEKKQSNCTNPDPWARIKHGGYAVNCISEPAIGHQLPKGLKLIPGYSPLSPGSCRV